MAIVVYRRSQNVVINQFEADPSCSVRTHTAPTPSHNWARPKAREGRYVPPDERSNLLLTRSRRTFPLGGLLSCASEGDDAVALGYHVRQAVGVVLVGDVCKIEQPLHTRGDHVCKIATNPIHGVIIKHLARAETEAIYNQLGSFRQLPPVQF
mmetsp:Transcript_89629/g.262044  ORF Transcript_89629/g.262044 Transcript_89629/m.262044 type:complete len:153 (+) Transcript_89629:568-1026(+)